MKININVDENAGDLTIEVTCRSLTPEIERLMENLRMMNHQITGRKGDDIFSFPSKRLSILRALTGNVFCTPRRMSTNRRCGSTNLSGSWRNTASCASANRRLSTFRMFSP